MKLSLLLGIILLSCVMLDTTYSQSLIEKIKKEQTIAYSYFLGERKGEKNSNKKAIAHYERSIKDMQGLPSDVIIQNQLTNAYVNLGILYSPLDHKKALDNKVKFYNYSSEELRKLNQDDIITENLYVKNAEEGWKPIESKSSNIAITSNNGTMYFYNAKRLKKKNGIIKVWTKIEQTGIKPLSENEFDEYLKQAREKTTKDPDELLKVRFPYEIYLEEYDCNNQRSRILQIVSYKEDGSVISSNDYNNSEWSDIIPNTIGEQILEFFCK